MRAYRRPAGLELQTRIELREANALEDRWLVGLGKGCGIVGTGAPVRGACVVGLDRPVYVFSNI